MNAPATTTDAHGILERVLAVGDLAQLTPAERNAYYNAVCKSIGLNPLTRPLEYIRLQGKLVLYARRDAADQLRALHGVSLRILSQEFKGDLFSVTVEAKTKEGRADCDMGVVSIAGLKGEALANAILKGLTKAKRRVTLSICGLGFLDETEVADIPQRQEWQEPATGEVTEPALPKPAALDFWSRDSLTIPVNGGGWQKWQGRLAKAIEAAPTVEKLDKLEADNLLNLDSLRAEIEPAYHALVSKFENARLLLADNEAPVFGEDEDGRTSSA